MAEAKEENILVGLQDKYPRDIPLKISSCT
jgi:hypothetical protein